MNPADLHETVQLIMEETLGDLRRVPCEPKEFLGLLELAIHLLEEERGIVTHKSGKFSRYLGGA